MCFPHEEPVGQGRKTPRLRLRRAQAATGVQRALLPRTAKIGKVLAPARSAGTVTGIAR
jgi:hypothetical protein